MSIRARFILVVSLVGAAVGISSFILLDKSHNELIEKEAQRIA